MSQLPYNAAGTIDIAPSSGVYYQSKYSAYCERYERANARLAQINARCLEYTAKRVKIQMFMEQLKSKEELVTDFDEELWYSTVDYVTVHRKKKMVFTFRDGRQVEIPAEMWTAA